MSLPTDRANKWMVFTDSNGSVPNVPVSVAAPSASTQVAPPARLVQAKKPMPVRPPKPPAQIPAQINRQPLIPQQRAQANPVAKINKDPILLPRQGAIPSNVSKAPVSLPGKREKQNINNQAGLSSGICGLCGF